MVSRITPLGEAAQYQTYSIRAGRDGTVVAACKDVGCQWWAHGWEIAADEATPLGRAQARYIRHESGRTFTEHRSGGLTVFRFEAFQRCFEEHRTRPDVFVRRDGDWRGNPTGRVYRHAGPAQWAEDFAEHEAGLADIKRRG